jgi:hypothetical protein
MSKAPRTDFALPGKKAFPLNTAGRVQVADKDAVIAEKAGSITPAEAATVKSKVAAKNHNPDNFLPPQAFHKNRGM